MEMKLIKMIIHKIYKINKFYYYIEDYYIK